MRELIVTTGITVEDKTVIVTTTFFAHTHMGAQQVYWPAAKVLLTPSSGFTQGDVNSSKLFTCNTASLVAG